MPIFIGANPLGKNVKGIVSANIAVTESENGNINGLIFADTTLGKPATPPDSDTYVFQDGNNYTFQDGNNFIFN